MNRVYIIIVNWNGWQDTIACIDSLLLLTYDNYRIIVCDNGSSDESLVKLRQWGENRFGPGAGGWQELDRYRAELGCDAADVAFTLVDVGTNPGFGAGNNVGLRYALARGDADYCWLLNNDTVVDSAALSAMVSRLDEKPDAGMCGSTVRYYQNRTRIQALGGAIYIKWLGVAWHIGRTLHGDLLPDTESVEKKMDYVVGSSLLVRVEFLKDIGLMAEDYFLFFEEIDWSTRAYGRYTLAYAPGSVVYHRGGASIGTASDPRRKSYQCDYYTLRNRLLFTRKYFPSLLVGVYAGLVIEMLVRILCGRWDLVQMIYRILFYGVAADEIAAGSKRAVNE